ncbi:2-dehydropantoate 2-reductase [Limnochorda pilosa]|uniref:2-dehydropantoate 2-reductase n=1 Tax=Limnochorda pilosa TaxID=1555112 RepID=A0A0K2SKG8_LIMPI|nr:2-dehydropantoate 2-reductase [Limnochorda pilosa]BAS27334.1 2-dehydropantoate 2-reductase [Limnochorda pilosa]
MRIGVVGVGAVGGFFGCLLSRAAAEVTLLARGAHLEAIRRDGLRVRSPLAADDGGEWVARPAATDDPALAGPQDLILFAVKSYDTEEVARIMAPMVASETTILCLQNGVDNEAKLAALYGEDRVLPGVVYIGAERVAPGLIEHRARGEILFGEAAGGRSERVERIRQVLAAAGIQVHAVDDIRSAKWEKFLFNVGLNAFSALTGGTAARLVATPAARWVFETSLGEALAVARASGVDLGEDVIERLVRTASAMHVTSSMEQDLSHGRPLELDTFNGYVVREGRRLGLETPVNATLYGVMEVRAEVGRG